MAYTHEQKRVIHHILSVGHKLHASQKEMLTAIVVGLHESGLTNPHYGDRDSEGWRQERKQFYKDPTNIRHSAARFFQELRAERGKGLSVGQLAQAVQRSGNAHGFEGGGLLQQAQDILHGWHRGAFGRPGRGGAGGGGGGGQTLLSVRGIHGPQVVPGRISTDTTGALIDSLIAGGTGKRHGSLLQDVVHRIDSGAYQVQGPTKVLPGQVAVKHVHVGGGGSGGGGFPHGVGAHGTPNLLIHIGHLAQKLGLHVGENPNFGAVTAVHAPGSYHYKNEAIDISGDAKTMAHLARIVEKRYGRHLAELIHNSPYGSFAIKHGHRVNGPAFYSGVWAGHRNHVHVAVGRGDHGRA